MSGPGTSTAPVALVVPCHNYGRFAAEALRSIAAQDVRAAEVVVVDDGSTDNSAQTLLALREELAEQLDVRVLLRPHEGLPATVLAGLHETSSPLFAVVSADDRVLPGFVGQLATALEDRVDAAFAYPKMRLFGDEDGIYQTYEFEVDRLLFDQNYVPGIAMMRRAAYEQVGGLRGLVAYEDWDLFLSFAEHGWTGVLVPEVLYEWRRHGAARNHVGLGTRLREETAGVGVDIVLEMSGAESAIRQGFDAVTNGGRVSLLGLPERPITLDLSDQIIFKGIRVYGITGRKMFETWYRTQALLAQGLDLSPIVTHRMPLSRFEEAFGLLAAGHAGKVVLLPQEG
jgi:glycosyltransferase involved in cell wall biosynthesis